MNLVNHKNGTAGWTHLNLVANGALTATIFYTQTNIIGTFCGIGMDRIRVCRSIAISEVP